MALTAITDFPNIGTDFGGFRSRRSSRRGQFYTNCPLARATTYYVNASGTGSGDGSESDPFATLAEVRSALADNTRFRFNRGDEWNDATGLTVTYDNVTFDDYGSSSLAKPLLNCFTLKYLSADTLWGSQSGNRWQINSVTDDVAYVRLVSDRLFTTRGDHLTIASSAATCASIANSFWYDPTGHVLYINLNGDDPNDYDIEAVASNTADGVLFSGDGCRCQNLRADGYGSHRTTSGTQRQPFSNRSSGQDANLFIGCEGYFSNSHVLAHFSGAGGLSYWENCTGGFSHNPGGTGTTFNSYSASGDNETWFDGCVAKYGQIKSPSWSYSTIKVVATGFFAHTSGDGFPQAAIVYYNCSTDSNAIASHRRLSDILHAPAIGSNDALTDCRAFTVNCLHPVVASGHQSNYMAHYGNQVIYGTKQYFKPISGSIFWGATEPRPSQLYYINSLIDIDFVSKGDADESGENGASGTTGMHFIHTDILLHNISRNTGAARAFGLDYDVMWNGSAAPGAANATNSRMFNCVYAGEYASGKTGAIYVALTNSSAALKNNAYKNITQGTSLDSQAGNTANPVTLSSMPVFGTENAQLLGAGYTGIVLSHDINGKPRTVSPPDIGSIDYSSPNPSQSQGKRSHRRLALYRSC